MEQLSLGFDSQSFMNRLKKGEQLHCPCCGRYAQVYKRRIYATIVRQYIVAYKLGAEHKYVGYNDIAKVVGVTLHGDWSKGKYWDLVEQKPKDDHSATKTSGLWKLTAKGVAFIKGEISIPTFAYIFDNNVIEFSIETSTVQDALTENFDYAALMNAPGVAA